MSVPLPTPEGPVTTRTAIGRLQTGAMRRHRTLALLGQAFGPASLPGLVFAPARGLSAQVRNELAALALGEAADRLRRRDPALREDAVHLHAPVLRHRQQQVEDLRRLEVLGRVEQQPLDLRATRLQVPLQGGSARTDLVRSLERIHALCQRPLGSRTRRRLRRGLGGRGRHAARLYTWEGDRQPLPTHFLANSAGPQPELDRGWAYLTLFTVLCRDFVI